MSWPGCRFEVDRGWAARRLPACAFALLSLAGCATRPVNAPEATYRPDAGYQFLARQQGNRENIVILAFSGGGMRAAAFSYGVLELLRDTAMIDRNGVQRPLLDDVNVITGVSGGSFTALAYGTVWVETVRSIRAALPAARRPGRACRAGFEPCQLACARFGRMGTIGTGGPALRRALVRSCHLWRHRTPGSALDCRFGRRTSLPARAPNSTRAFLT